MSVRASVLQALARSFILHGKAYFVPKNIPYRPGAGYTAYDCHRDIDNKNLFKIPLFYKFIELIHNTQLVYQ